MGRNKYVRNPIQICFKHFSYFIATCWLLSSPAFALEQKKLVGTWALQSYILTDNGAEKPWCINPFGIISYFSNGHMAIGINCKKSDNEKEVTPDQKDMVFYTGKYSIKQPNIVVHHVENSSEISRIGKDLERTVEMNGDRVTLTGMGVKGPFRLVWKKRK